MRKLIISALALVASVAVCSAQSIWDRGHLDRVKTQLSRPMYAEAYGALIRQADSLLCVTPISVMDKKRPCPNGDNHNYTSLARYFHPDPKKPDGLPYISLDGQTNPEIGLYDRNNLGKMASRVCTLSLAYHFSGDERYAAKAAEMLKVWFFNPATRMNPNLEYSQMVPGQNNNKGRSAGLIDTYSFVEMLDGVALLGGSKSWTKKNDKDLRKWFGQMIDWMQTSKQGIAESKAANNHSTAYDAQVIAFAMYAGRNDLAKKLIAGIPESRMFPQIEPDGRQPQEMRRTLSYHYSHYNITHFIDIFLMGQKLGLKIDNATSPDGRSFYKALDYVAAYLGKPLSAWPGKQLSGYEERQQDVAKDLWRVASFIDPSRDDYRKMYHDHRIFNPSERFTLLYYTPDETDDAFTHAAATLTYACKRAAAERKVEANAAKRRVSPRTTDADGKMKLVHPNDWVSGFFPGELWMMYQFTNDPYWREQAVSFTWPIEDAALNRGTHDLGFMIGDSFGKAWQLTGEKSYFDVVHRAARTLSTRFNPTVGLIRSWDHNPNRWKFPVIIDNMMNLEMMFRMANATGNKKFRDIAVSHADVTMKNHFRPDCSSFHVVDYDPADGSVRMKVTAQGYADDSFWSRGQSWGLYGYTMCYRFTNDKRYLDQATRIADWFLALPNMPSDGIPFWDMKAPGTDVADNPAVPRDASTATIFSSGLYELALYVDAPRAARYRAAADKMLGSLAASYRFAPTEGDGFILRHSTGHHPAGSEIDVPLAYADYYYLEAMLRKRDVAKMIK